jgi:hypothetical protein
MASRRRAHSRGRADAPGQRLRRIEARVRARLPWYRRAHAIRHVSLRYFNACGATERCGERHEPETHLIPILLDVASGRRDAIQLFGTDYDTPDGRACATTSTSRHRRGARAVPGAARLRSAATVFNLGTAPATPTAR